METPLKVKDDRPSPGRTYDRNRLEFTPPQRMWFSVTFLLICINILVCSAATLAPLHVYPGAQPIKGRYIVVLRQQGSSTEQLGIQSTNEIHKLWLIDKIQTSDAEARILHFFSAVPGYALQTESQEMLNAIRERPEVSFLEQDHIVHIWDKHWRTKASKRKSILDRLKQNFLRRNRLSTLSQNHAPWGLSRLSCKKHSKFTGGPDNSKPLDSTYFYPRSSGSGVDVYVLDTGIYLKHSELEGRARWGITIPQYDVDIDAHGHGTHCAGVIGGKTYGVAKKASLIAVKVLRSNGFGSNSDVIKGIEWVVQQHQMNSPRGAPYRNKSIINMSLGGPHSYMLDMMVDAAIDAGISIVAAAGNEFDDSCNYSPSSNSRVVTVGAIDSTDSMAFFSNFGRCVDIFAPGVSILSAWIGKPNAFQVLSGTSMAGPHVAGAMALYLADGEYEPAQLKEIVLSNSLVGFLQGIPNDGATPNALVSTSALIEEGQFLQKG